MTLTEIKGITVFFPAFNDERSIADLVLKAKDVCSEFTDDVELIVVNDGSVDNTAGELLELQEVVPELQVITHQVNRGYGAAVSAGIGAASKEFVFYTDGDGQYDVGDLRLLINALNEDVDIVNGFKLNRADALHRRVLGDIYSRFARTLFHLPIRDVDCDFRLMRRRVVQRLELRSSSGAICVELVHQLNKAGARFAEVGIPHYPRVAGRSQFFSPVRIYRTFLQLGSLRRRAFAVHGSLHTEK